MNNHSCRHTPPTADDVFILPGITDTAKQLTGCPMGCGPDGHEPPCSVGLDLHDRGAVDYADSAAWRLADGRPELVDFREFAEARR